MDIIIHGSTGRMGQMVAAACEQGISGGHAVAFISPDNKEEVPETNTFFTIDKYNGPADCVIDFSHHSATKPLMDYCVARKMPVVVCTTGQSEEEMAYIKEASKQIPVFKSANMSVGVAATADLARRAAALFPDADIEIIEMHHNQKLDAPSGTALMIANEIKTVRTEAEYVLGRSGQGKRTKQEIGIHAVRLGNEVGTHEVIIATGNERITIKHEAQSRALFANGALAAAAFLCGKPAGFYDMKDLVG